MFSRSAKIAVPTIGFVLGLVATYGLADAGSGPVPPRILQDTLVLRTSIGSGIRDISDARFTSFEERFAGERGKAGGTRKSPLAQTGSGLRFASLEMPVNSNVLGDARPVLVASLGDRILLDERSDSFAERFGGARDLASAVYLASRRESSWVAQLIGDDTEATALSRFRELQNKHKSILGNYEPIVVRTTLKPGAPPVWTRVRVGPGSREAAETLCTQLEAAGARCVVQRNINS